MNTYNLIFTYDELSTIFGALQELPYKKAAPVISTIQQQIAASEAEKQKQEEFTDEEVKEHLEGDKE